MPTDRLAGWLLLVASMVALVWSMSMELSPWRPLVLVTGLFLLVSGTTLAWPGRRLMWKTKVSDWEEKA